MTGSLGTAPINGVNGVVRMDLTCNMTMSVLMHGVLNGIWLVMRRCLLGAVGGGAGCEQCLAGCGVAPIGAGS
jgi:hypothetical protein